MNVIAWTFHPGGDTAEWVSFEDVFRRSDAVSVHVRQSPQTSGMIRREHFQIMKPGAFFINTARGGISSGNWILSKRCTRSGLPAPVWMFLKRSRFLRAARS
jgi:phosphoglycerate dehydrogenase-like enzyme